MGVKLVVIEPTSFTKDGRVIAVSSYPRDIPTSLCHSGEWTLELLLRECRWHQHNSHQDSGCVGTIPVRGLATALSFLEQ